MRRDASGLRDRVLAAFEVSALGIWLGSLVGFAFISAPLAFRYVASLDVGRFAAFIGSTISVLTVVGYALGGIAIVAAVLRAATAGDRVWDAVRIALIALALGLATYEEQAIVPAMAATLDVHGAAYHELHDRSTNVYGGVVLLVFVALILAAARREDA